MSRRKELLSFEPMTKRVTKRGKFLPQKDNWPPKENKHKPSHMEIRVAKLLDSLRVKYVAEKTFPRLVSELYPDTLLPIDFYLPDLKACCEIDGLHHTAIMSDDKPHSLDKRKLNDATRDLFCMKRGFTMLRLNHTQFDDYKEIITEFINKLKSR